MKYVPVTFTCCPVCFSKEGEEHVLGCAFDKVLTPSVVSVHMSDLKADAEYWRKAVRYLASCNAATLESLPKSTSKSAVKRFKALVKASLEMLTYRWSSPSLMSSTEDSVKARCEKCLVEASQPGSENI